MVEDVDSRGAGARRSGGSERASAGAGRERLQLIQRARIIAALTEIVAERGASHATVGPIVERSGLSRRTFYEIFEDRDDCLFAALDEGTAQIAADVAAAYRRSVNGRRPSAQAWREAIRAGLIAALSYIEGAPSMARLLMVESWGAQRELLERRNRALEQLIGAVEEGGRTIRVTGETARGSAPVPLTAEWVVGATLAVIHARVVEAGPGGGEPGSLVALTNQLMSMIVLPYLGAAAARRELERPTPQTPLPPREPSGVSLRELKIRLTYRTVRVLSAVAANPGSSNRQVADDSGIRDQGQISKLLARLQRRGLIANEGEGHSSGEPNVWKLTDRGEGVYAALAGIRESRPGTTATL